MSFPILMTVVIMHRGLPPNPLPAANLSHLSVLDHFFKAANLVCKGNLVMNAIKNLEGLRWVRERQLVCSCTELLYCSHHRFDESIDPRRAEYHDPVEIDFYAFFDMQSIQTLFACRAARHTGSTVYHLGQSCIQIKYNTEGYVPWPCYWIENNVHLWWEQGNI